MSGWGERAGGESGLSSQGEEQQQERERDRKGKRPVAEDECRADEPEGDSGVENGAGGSHKRPRAEQDEENGEEEIVPEPPGTVDPNEILPPSARRKAAPTHFPKAALEGHQAGDEDEEEDEDADADWDENRKDDVEPDDSAHDDFEDDDEAAEDEESEEEDEDDDGEEEVEDDAEALAESVRDDGGDY